MLRRSIQTVAALFALYLLLSVAAGVYLAEAAIHVRRKAITQRSEYASMVGDYYRSGWKQLFRMSSCVTASHSPMRNPNRPSRPALFLRCSSQGRRIVTSHPSHAIAILRIAPVGDVLWEVPGAGHGGAPRAAGPAFDSRVLDWFRSHRRLDR